jgi:hypothetical protein
MKDFSLNTFTLPFLKFVVAKLFLEKFKIFVGVANKIKGKREMLSYEKSVIINIVYI